MRMGLVRQSGGSGDPSPLGQKENFPERTRLRAPPPGSQPRTSSHPAAPKALPGRVTPFVVANNEQQAEGSTGLGRGEPGRLHPAGRLGARGRMKDAASTDVIVPAGVAVASFWQCGDLYLLDPLTLDDLGKCSWGGSFPAEAGVSAHTKVDDHAGELLFFNYGTTATYLHYGVVDASNRLVHYVPIDLPGPRPVRVPVPPGHPVPPRRHPAPRRHRRHPLVRDPAGGPTAIITPPPTNQAGSCSAGWSSTTP